MRICELKNKEVVNICDGRMIGFVSDVDFDINKGVICSIIVPGPAKCFSFWVHDIEYVIPFDRIECIGPDVVLVKVCLDDVKRKCG